MRNIIRLGEEAPAGLTAQYITLARALGLALQITEDELTQIESKGYSISSSSLQIEARFITVVILSAALCESMGNTILATLLDPAAFRSVERTPSVEKWTVHIPAAMAYPELISASLSKDLADLFSIRHSIMHPKAKVFSENTTIHAGSSNMWDCLETPSNVRKFASIPIKLADAIPFDSQGMAKSIAHGVKEFHLIRALSHEPKAFNQPQ